MALGEGSFGMIEPTSRAEPAVELGRSKADESSTAAAAAALLLLLPSAVVAAAALMLL